MNLYHYTDKASFTIENIPGGIDPARFSFKPAGIWYSVEDAWAEWCLGNDFCPSAGLRYRYQLTLNYDRILQLRPEDLAEFAKQYYRYEYHNHQWDGIDWAAVVAEFDGLECFTYDKTLALNWVYADIEVAGGYSWYSGLDIPSGCIWNRDAVIKVGPREEGVVAPPPFTEEDLLNI